MKTTFILFLYTVDEHKIRMLENQIKLQALKQHNRNQYFRL